MNTNSSSNLRAATERLMQEFTSNSSDDAPICHQRLSGLPDQKLTKATWDEFRLANYGRFDRKTKGQWQEWFAHPNGSVCSQFVGVGDKAALDRFRRLADTGMALLKAAAATAETTWHFDTSIYAQIKAEPTGETFVHWLETAALDGEAMQDAVSACYSRQLGLLLKTERIRRGSRFGYAEPTDFGLVALPIHPIMESLQYDVFRSSVEAIKVWLGMDDVVRVGDWPDRPPIYLPSLSKVPQQDVENDESRSSPAPTTNKLVVQNQDTFSVSHQEEDPATWETTLRFTC